MSVIGFRAITSIRSWIKNCIDPQQTFEKLLAIQDESGTNPALLEYSINLVKLWSEHLAYLWDRNKFIAAETVLKHHVRLDHGRSV